MENLTAVSSSQILAIEVRSRVAGVNPLPPEMGPVFVDVGLDETVTLEELIHRTVAEQVRELVARRRLDEMKARQVLDRQYLTPEEVRTQSSDGVVRYPSDQGKRARRIEVEDEIQKALRGFERAAYYVFVDGTQVGELKEVVRFRPGTRVVFLRLMPLVGG